MQEGINKAKDGARANLFDATASAAAVIGPMIKATNVFATFEDKLTDVGIKGELTGQKLVAFGNEMKALGPSVNKTAVELLSGVDKLVEGGVKFEAARQSIELIAKASVATKASMEDLSKTTVALINNLGVAPGAELTKALDALAQSGKEGQFELKGMAHYLPQLAAQFGAMGQKGADAAAQIGAVLQVIRGQTGQDQSAVVALEDLMNKITLGPTKKAFEELGIDIVAVMEKGKKAGRVFETMNEVLNKATGGDASKLQNIFGDKQALAGARALMQDFKKYEDILAKARGATGVIDQDFLTRMGLTIEKQKALGTAMEGFWLALGTAVAPVVGAFIEKLTEWLNIATRLIEAHPHLTAGIMTALAAFTGLMVVMAALKFSALVFASGIAQLSGVIVGLIKAVRFLVAVGGLMRSFWLGIKIGIAQAGGLSWILSNLYVQLRLISAFSFVLLSKKIKSLAAAAIPALRALGVAFMVAGRAFIGMGAAMIANPIGAVIAAIAVGAALIYTNWDKLGPMFESLWEGIKTTTSAAWESIKSTMKAAWDGVANGIQAGIDAIKGAFNGFVGFFADLGSSLISAVTSAFAPVTDFIDRVFTRISNVYEGAKGLLGFGGGTEQPAVTKAVDVTTTIAQATKANEQINAIPPAATQAASAANAVLAAQDFHSHGVRLMETLAAGIRAGAASAVAAVAQTVQKMRDHLPHSPAKVGPLSDLDKVQFSQTLAGAIEAGAPRAFAAARMVAAGLAASLPGSGMAYAGAAPDAPGVAQSFGSSPARAASPGGTGGGRLEHHRQFLGQSDGWCCGRYQKPA